MGCTDITKVASALHLGNFVFLRSVLQLSAPDARKFKIMWESLQESSEQSSQLGRVQTLAPAREEPKPLQRMMPQTPVVGGTGVPKAWLLDEVASSPSKSFKDAASKSRAQPMSISKSIDPRLPFGIAVNEELKVQDLIF